jgi:hypothetical protein
VDWACTRDNVTGLVWEVKTADGGLRDQAKTYTNFDDVTQAQFYFGSAYVNPTQTQIDAPTNSIGFATAVNSTALCGNTDWRRPSIDELLGLLDNAGTPSKINQTYFPNTLSSAFLSASAYFDYSNSTWGVLFSFGTANNTHRTATYQVRLVRAGQSLATFGLSVGTMGSGAGRVSSTTGLFCTREGGVSYGTCRSVRASGGSVTLTATPAAGSAFTGWGGACSAALTAATCTLKMTPARAVTASFAVAPAVAQIVVDPTAPTSLYAALDGSGVFASNDSGASWGTITEKGLANLNVRALAILKRDLFAATYDGGVFKGTLGAGFATWATCGSGLGAARLRSLTVDTGGNLYAGSETGVFKGHVDCRDWVEMNAGLPN